MNIRFPAGLDSVDRKKLESTYERRFIDEIETLKPGMTFVDIGAYAGYHTLKALATGAFVYAFEPHPIIFNYLISNCRDNGYTRGTHYRAYQQALSNTNNTAYLHCRSNLSQCSLEKQESNQADILIDVTTLDTWLGDKQVDMVKIDAEGHELKVLQGMTRILKQNPTLLIEVHRARFNITQSLVKALVPTNAKLIMIVK